MPLGGLAHALLFFGAASLAVALGACYGLVLAIGQAVERATGGWDARSGNTALPADHQVRARCQ